MFEAGKAYVGGSVRAAEAVRDGASLAFSLSGGLHHARRSMASGFCIFNDCAIACSILRESFDRVAYVDIDVHHGDGVQGIFYDDPTVLTCSIHQDGRTIYPGTGFVDETGADFSAINVPLAPGTTGDAWLDAFDQTIIPAIRAFRPGAIVLQMGTDAHFQDRLGHLRLTAQEWLQAVAAVRSLGLPVVALGGGGYTLTTVPRMWAAACLTLGKIEFGDALPSDLVDELEVDRFFDAEPPLPRDQGRVQAERVVSELKRIFGGRLECG
jgi:acetoin utilization protein AcuC